MKKPLFLLLTIAALLPLALFAQSGFETQDAGMTGSLRGLSAVTARVVWVSGTKGEFSLTKNGGYTWYHDTVPGAGKLDFRDVHAFSGKTALLMSAGPGAGSAIFRTVDGGRNWTRVYQNSDPKAFFDGMDFFDDKQGLIIGDPVDEKPYLLETKDGGLTWARLIPDRIPDLIPGEYAFAASGTSLDACSDGSCYIATGGSAARVFRSANRGKTWDVASLLLLQGDPAAGAFSVERGPGNLVAAVGGNYQKMTVTGANLTLSEDGGKTWRLPAGSAKLPFMECVRWIDASTLAVCGPPGVWLSSDGGATWEEHSTQAFHTMEVAPGHGTMWLAGNKGLVVKWR
jgi:photosystem II stability/assembly factor-like uncharacterized protein